MKKFTYILAVINLFMLFFMVVHYANADNDVKRLIPSPGFSKEWIIGDRIKTFGPERLYEHINGEAELYLSYGFESLAATVYVSRDNPDKALAVNVFRMRSLLDAFGIYSRYREPDAQRLNIGGGCFINDSQLMFFKGKYFIQLSASGAANPEPEVFVDCAALIAKNIPGDLSEPAELDYLVITGLIKGSETYYSQSVLGYAFFRKGLAARVILKDETVRVFVVLGESETDVDAMFMQYSGYLKNAGAKAEIKMQGGMPVIIAVDPLYKGVTLSKSGRHLVGAANLSNPPEGLLLIEKMLLRIR